MFGKTVSLQAAWLCIFACTYHNSTFAQHNFAREYQLKAAYIYNFIKFIDWPSSSQQQRQSTRICVFGSYPFGKYLDNLEANKAKGKAIEIVHAADESTLSNCHILYFLKDTPQTEKVLAQWSSAPVLTVGENRSFLSNGGIINLVMNANNIQVHINQRKARENGFKISGHLLEIATVVY